MADKTVGELPKATSVDAESLFVMEQQGIAQSVTGGQIAQFAQDVVAGDVADAKQAATDAENSAQDAADSAQAAADKAEEAANIATKPPIIRDDHWWTWDNEQGDYVDTGLDVGLSLSVDPDTVTGEAGSSASVENTGTQTDPVLKFTIPQGIKGDTGDVWTPSVDEDGNLSWTKNSDDPQDMNIKGPQGDTGDVWTPSVDKEGTLSWTKNGVDPEEANIRGPQGVSPTVSVTKEGGVATVTITDVEGEHKFEVKDGEITNLPDNLLLEEDTGDPEVTKVATLQDGTHVSLKTLLESIRTEGESDQILETDGNGGVKLDAGTWRTTIDEIDQKTDDILDKLTSRKPKLYTLVINVNEQNPAIRCEYKDDCEGFIPAKMNYATGAFEYGDWKDVWFIRDNYPVMLKNDCTEDYRLDPNDYSKKLRDGSASDVSSATYAGNAMAAIPLVYVARWQEGNYQYLCFSDTKYDERFEAFAHTDAKGNIQPVTYHSLFKGSMVDSTLRSIAGQVPKNNTNAQEELTAAQKNGTGWTLRTWALQSLIADLCTLISKTFDSQTAFGNGIITGGSAADTKFGTCGELKDKGQFFGYNTQTDHMKVFHIEDFWGCRWDRLVGLMFVNGVWKVKMTPEGSGYNFTGAGYTPVGTGISGQSATNGSGWQRATEQTPYGRFPIAPLTGSQTTYETDLLWWNNTITSVALAGGASAHGFFCGARSLLVDSLASRANWSFGASLSCQIPS